MTGSSPASNKNHKSPSPPFGQGRVGGIWQPLHVNPLSWWEETVSSVMAEIATQPLMGEGIEITYDVDFKYSNCSFS